MTRYAAFWVEESERLACTDLLCYVGVLRCASDAACNISGKTVKVDLVVK